MFFAIVLFPVFFPVIFSGYGFAKQYIQFAAPSGINLASAVIEEGKNEGSTSTSNSNSIAPTPTHSPAPTSPSSSSSTAAATVSENTQPVAGISLAVPAPALMGGSLGLSLQSPSFMEAGPVTMSVTTPSPSFSPTPSPSPSTYVTRGFAAPSASSSSSSSSHHPAASAAATASSFQSVCCRFFC